MKFAVPCFVAVLAAASLSSAERLEHDRVSPLIDGWFHSQTMRTFWGQHAPGTTPERVPVLIRMSDEASATRLVRSQDDALRVFGQYKNFVSATITQGTAESLRRDRNVVRVEIDLPPPTPAPLLRTSGVIAAEVSRLRGHEGNDLDGSGVVVADIDSGTDVFHPMMFHADGGYFDWIDTDGNGRFDPFIDAIDRNRNGSAEPNETTGYWEGVALGPSGPILDTNNGSYTPGVDHLYVDENGDMIRNYGPAQGFTDETPTFGEPLFVADDVNGNGFVEVGEKFVALGTSKVRAVFSTSVFTRGVDLVDTPGHDDPSGSHGVGVLGILGGGQPGHSLYTGIAPGVEMLVTAYQQLSGAPFTSMLMWAIDEGADIVLHEYAPWVGYHRDGSSNVEQLMNSSAAGGVAHVNPTGNLGGSRKHAISELGSGATTNLGFVVPGSGYDYAGLSMAWRRPTREMSVILTAPDGDSRNLGIDGQGATSMTDGTSIFASVDISVGGTARYDVTLSRSSGFLQTGDWTLTVSDETGGQGSTELALYVQDNRSSWGLGVRFEDSIVSEKYLVGFPATADSAIAVAAFAGRDDGPFGFGQAESVGQLRSYSCRGARIDGVSVMDIGAPDNALTAEIKLPGGEAGGYRIFGGTSGAGPHVAGTAALLKQLRPELDGNQVRDAIREGATQDADVAATSEHSIPDLWGAGKLNTYKTLFGAVAPANTPPNLGTGPVSVQLGERNLLATFDVSDAEDELADLQVYVDLDYDGTWDLGPVPAAGELPYSFEELGESLFKIEVRDSQGQRSAALLRLTVIPTEDSGGCGCAADPGPQQRLSWALLVLGLVIVLRRQGRRKRKMATEIP